MKNKKKITLRNILVEEGSTEMERIRRIVIKFT